MADGFETMVDDAQAFFTELAANNEKAWFEPRKAHYTDAIRKPAEFFADLVSEELTKSFGRTMSPKVFRIYRDVRFSKDKTPYNAHLHMLWSAGQQTTPAIFFAVEPSGLWLGMGLFGFKGEMLTRWRAFIDREGEEVAGEIARLERDLGARISDFGPEPLKRVPKPYDQDHPQAELLKRKGLAIGADMPADWRDTGLVKSVVETSGAFLPLWRLMAERI